MAKFLYSAKDRNGISTTDSIAAETISAARYALETRGYSDITFHTDEYSTKLDAGLYEGEPTPDDVLSPAEEVAARRGKGVVQSLFDAFTSHWLFWLPLAIWDYFAIKHGSPFRIRDWIAFALSGLFVVYFIRLVLPSIAYQRLLEAGAWHRWSEVRAWAGFIRLLKLTGSAPIPDLELDFRLAYALAVEGKINEAVSQVKKYEDHKCGKSVYLGRLAGVYCGAKDYEKMTACRKETIQQGGITEKIDLVLGLLRYQRNPASARPILAEIDEAEAAELPQLFCKYCRGLLSVEENDWPAAETHLRKAVELGQPYINNPLMACMLKEVQAYLGIAIAHQGKIDEAKKLFADATPLLEARKEQELLDRCRASLKAS